MKREKKKKLRSGFTTGAAAAAATKGAMIALVENRFPQDVAVEFLNGETRRIEIRETRILSPNEAICTVVKDAGDDPDATNGAVIGVRLSLFQENGEPEIRISGGEGVGRVTKPGLEIPPGEPAINPGPRRMIRASAKEILNRNGKRNSIGVEIFVPDGERLAEKTLNAKLGVLGGISILGTTGIVRPMSHEAYTATISSALSVARASGCEEAVFSTGRRSERCAQKLFPETAPEAFVQIGDYFSEALSTAVRFGFRKVTMAVFFGKAVKMAQESPCTHARNSRLSLQALSEWCLNEGCPEDLAKRLANANTAREAFGILIDERPSAIETVGAKLVKAAEKFARNRLLVNAVIFDFDEKIAWRGGAGKAAN